MALFCNIAGCTSGILTPLDNLVKANAEHITYPGEWVRIWFWLILISIFFHVMSDEDIDNANLEQLVYVYSNSKLVASTPSRDADRDKLKMFAWDKEDVEVLHCRLV